MTLKLLIALALAFHGGGHAKSIEKYAAPHTLKWGTVYFPDGAGLGYKRGYGLTWISNRGHATYLGKP